MAFPTTYADTELAAVNQILEAVGQAPVTELEATNPEVAIAWDTLTAMSRECQAEGWSFNTERYYPIQPDSSGNVVIANNVLQLSLSRSINYNGLEVVRRDGKLYDKTNHTYNFSSYGTLECDVVWMFDFKDLPIPFQDYIIARASSMMSLKVTGEPTQYQLLQQREGLHRSIIMEYECNQGDYSMFGFQEGNQFYSSYQPFHTLSR